MELNVLNLILNYRAFAGPVNERVRKTFCQFLQTMTKLNWLGLINLHLISQRWFGLSCLFYSKNSILGVKKKRGDLALNFIILGSVVQKIFRVSHFLYQFIDSLLLIEHFELE